MYHSRLISLLAGFLFLCSGFVLNAQMEAITTEGDTVLLYDDGTWEYLNSDKEDPMGLPAIDSLPLNPHQYKKSATAKASAKDENNICEVWYNDKVWNRQPPGRLNSESSLAFSNKKGSCYAILISEPIELGLSTLRMAAITNARNAAPDMKLTVQEKRVVNGHEVLCMEMQGSIGGAVFHYLSYYYSNEKGSLQLITYTTQSLFEEMRPTLEEFLNGLVITED
ncbi:MAG: hypothetical protein H6565_11365 [Lewinellaceae bacterium]|nr:hypothetical protein [Saprospiraceae bacterium]MCB9307182.1 hypothetical protein [Lewinellaceae bacterium]MCB9353833.1 hypothetical protein [Lewinellaceae bacterium]